MCFPHEAVLKKLFRSTPQTHGVFSDALQVRHDAHGAVSAN